MARMSTTPNACTYAELPLAMFSAGARVENLTPAGYRLARKPNGELVLQVALLWSQGLTGGVEWRDTTTVLLEE